MALNLTLLKKICVFFVKFPSIYSTVMKKDNQLTQQWEVLKRHIEGYVLSVVKNTDDMHDIMQEVFIKAYTHYGNLKDATKLKQWLYSIARNEINAHFNTKKKSKQLLIDDDSEPVSLPNAHFEHCISTFINALPNKYREAVQLVEIENVPQTRLAEQLNISYSGAKTRVQRGREKLKQLIQQCCHINHDRYGNIVEYTPKQGGYCATYCR